MAEQAVEQPVREEGGYLENIVQKGAGYISTAIRIKPQLSGAT